MDMMGLFFIKIQQFLLRVIFPDTLQEKDIAQLFGRFPLHVSTHKVVDKKTGKLFEVTALSDYSDKKASLLIQALKFNNNKEARLILSQVLGDYLLEIVSAYITMNSGKSFGIIPMPLSRNRRRERGFNQIEVLLDDVVKRYPQLTQYIYTNILSKYKETKSQTHLNRKERLLNIRGSLKVHGKLPIDVFDILLIDDVITTGATVCEAGVVLYNAGARSVQVLTIARTL